NPSTESSEKNLLKKDIDEVAAAKKAEIEARKDLTQEEKDAAKSTVDAEANKAKAAIDVAKTSEEVQTAATAGITAIQAINPVAEVKPAAKAAIDAAAKAKKASLEARDDLTA
ncbi:DUF1542 domain-containing protein, partial [Streptococcus danieliae]|nr:DUF1542 domain-containing protein [Streptococcus danieliae]NYS49907.1 DUF1542 domain-containing protein [Streptococcus danieliae]